MFRILLQIFNELHITGKKLIVAFLAPSIFEIDYQTGSTKPYHCTVMNVTLTFIQVGVMLSFSRCILLHNMY